MKRAYKYDDRASLYRSAQDVTALMLEIKKIRREAEKIINESFKKKTKQDNEELKKAYKEAIRLWREDTEKRRVEQWIYDRGKPPEEGKVRSK